MNTITSLEDIKADLDRVDADSLLSIREIIDHSLRKVSALAAGSEPTRAARVAASGRQLKFVGKNLLPEEYQRLSLEERGELQWRLKQRNREWLQKKFLKLGAAWLVVVDGKIIASGKTLENKPMSPQILKICQRTGKFPFIFVNDKFITIEESVSAWQATIRAGDYYPTLPIKFGSASGVVELDGDFDTGSSHTFVDYDFLAAQNLIRPELRDYPEVHIHLNRPFVYIDKLMRIALPADSDETNAVNVRISCVQDWRSSPFREINPDRIALIGRDILLKLEPKILLDFKQHQTETLPSVTSGQTRKSKTGRKKRAPRRRR
jgi:hypothetical protein